MKSRKLILSWLGIALFFPFTTNILAQEEKEL